MTRTLLKTIPLALMICAGAATAAMANQMPQNPPNPTPLDSGEPAYYSQFDCKDINTFEEWDACWFNTSD